MERIRRNIATGANKIFNQIKSQVASTRPRPSDQELHRLIEKRAYDVFLKRGKRLGDSRNDWLEAERQIKREYNF